MTRSYKKTPVSPNTYAETEKEFKRRYNRKHRRTVKSILVKSANENLFDETIIPNKKIEISKIWDSPKEGKHYIDVKDLQKLKNKSNDNDENYIKKCFLRK